MTRRDDYVEKLKLQLDSLNAQITLLQARARAATGELKRELNDELSDIEQARERARLRLGELHRAGDAAWEDVKQGAETAWQALLRSVERASQRFK